MTAVECEICRMEFRWTGFCLEVAASLEGLWTPEHTQVAATANSLAVTFMALARRSRLPVFSFRTTASASVEELGEGKSGITRIVLEPKIAVMPQDAEKALEVFEKANKLCGFRESPDAVVQVKPDFLLAPVGIAC